MHHVLTRRTAAHVRTSTPVRILGGLLGADLLRAVREAAFDQGFAQGLATPLLAWVSHWRSLIEWPVAHLLEGRVERLPGGCCVLDGGGQ